MLFRLIDWIAVKNHRRKQPNIEWKNLLELLQNELGDFKFYLDTRKNGLIELNSVNNKNTQKGVLGVVATVAHKYKKPFETKEPIDLALSQLKSKGVLNAHILVSRNPKTFYGYYLYVRQNA